MGKRVDPRRVKSHWTLTPDEWADRLGVHKNTILRWIRIEGLDAITDQRPYLVRGVDLKFFLQSRRKTKRFNCRKGEMSCFSCSKPGRPLEGMLDYTPQNKTSGRLSSLCDVCLTPMNLMIREADISKHFPNCSVTLTRYQGTLSGSGKHYVNDHFEGSSKNLERTIPSTAISNRSSRKGPT